MNIVVDVIGLIGVAVCVGAVVLENRRKNRR
jgi:hypothetical protein